MFDIKEIFTYLATVRALYSAKRPWAHHSKKGPGRKHQQGRALTKQERDELKKE
jgi:hypothetical protein